MNVAIVAVLLASVVATGTAVVLAATTMRKLVAFALFGLSLTLLFFAYRAPDVALSEIAVGTIAVPFIVLVTLLRVAVIRKNAR